MIDKTISHYRILEKLGEGGMGVVYKAEDTKLKRIVALKFLPPEFTRDPQAKERFINEAQAASALQHHNICTIHDVDETDEGQVFISMDYYDGETLDKKIAHGQMIINEAIDISIQIAQGLSKAHEHRIIHRDIKPANIMITNDNQVIILDFGLAKLNDRTRHTATESTLGTLAYMSPEQIKGQDADIRSDIFSFGVTLYEMLTGTLPFPGTHEAAVMYSIVNELPYPVEKYRDDVPSELKTILEMTLEKKPQFRYQSMNDVLEDLRKIKKVYSDNSTLLIHKRQSSNRPIRVHQKTFVAFTTTWRQSKLPWILAVTIIIAAIIGVYLSMYVIKHGSIKNKTIAVLPFSNLSSNKEDEYFSDGITDDILTQLCKIADLKVIAHTSVMQYKGTKKTIHEIGKELNAGVILEGSVRRAGNHVRIVSQLIDANNDEHLWAETYDREMKDVFEIQSEIARRITDALEAKLSPAEKERFEKPVASNPDVYNLLLQGRYFFDRRDEQSVAKAVDLYKEALVIVNDDARVLAALSEAFSFQADQGYADMNEGYTKARQAAEEAISADDKLANGHTAIGRIKRNYDWDWTGADKEFTKALALEPGNVRTISFKALLSGTLGKFDEAIALERKALALDPVSVDILRNLSLNLLYADRLEDVIATLRKALELNPQDPGAHAFLGRVYLLRNQPDSAITELQKEPVEVWCWYVQALSYPIVKRKTEADVALKKFITKYQKVAAFQIAEIYAFRSDTEQAFEWLERAYNQRDSGLADLKGDPFLKNIEGDPRYILFMKKMKLPI